jgi:RNA polymerase sigma-70 factor (ECF subfamily)
MSANVLGASEKLKQRTDADILRMIMTGQSGAYGVIFARHREKAFALAYQYLHNREDAKDIVQDAFIKAYENLGKFNLSKKFSPWLLTIVRNLSIDFLRRNKRISDDGLPPVVSDERHHRRPDALLLRSEVWRALELLSENQREIIFLKDYQGHSYNEIAEILDIPLGTVMSRLHHARKNLIELLRKQ